MFQKKTKKNKGIEQKPKLINPRKRSLIKESTNSVVSSLTLTSQGVQAKY